MKNKQSIVYRAAKNLIGKFSSESRISSVEDGKLLLKGDDLYFCGKTVQAKLNPINDAAKEIIELFDLDALENSSLYEMEISTEGVQVTFHRFSRPVQKMIDPSKG